MPKPGKERSKMKIAGCLGCEYCHTKGEGKCIQKDDMDKVMPAYLETQSPPPRFFLRAPARRPPPSKGSPTAGRRLCSFPPAPREPAKARSRLTRQRWATWASRTAAYAGCSERTIRAKRKWPKSKPGRRDCKAAFFADKTVGTVPGVWPDTRDCPHCLIICSLLRLL